MTSSITEGKVKSYAYNIRTCSLIFRELLLELLPGLGRNKGHWRLFFKLLYSENNQTIVSQERVAAYYEAKKDLENHKFSAIYYLELFQAEVAPLEIIEYSFVGGKAREVKIVLPVEILTFREYELNGNYKGSLRVMVSDGSKFNPKNIKKLEVEDMELVKPAFYEEAVFIQNYLNFLPKACFANVVKRIDEAESHLCDRESDGSRIIKDVITQQINLRTLAEQPKPIYSVTANGNTARLFAVNASLQGIHSHLRKYLTQDWVELDLSQAHLAIVAHLWNIPILHSFLKSDHSIWESLLPHMGYAANDLKIKASVKEFIYSLVYGMSQANLEANITADLSAEAYKAFMSYPLIGEIVKARKLKVKELTDAGTYTTTLGKTYEIYNRQNFKTKEFETNVNSVLATEASEVELLLMYPIFKLASTSKSFKVLLYQFDGVSINVKDKSRIDSVIRAIQNEVTNTATLLNIPTKLEVKINKLEIPEPSIPKPQITVGEFISNSIRKHFKF